MSVGCRGNTCRKPMSLAPQRTLETLKFMPIIDSSLLLCNTSFDTDGKSYGKAQFLLDA